MDSKTCPLCNSTTTVFHEDKRRKYYRCHTCELVHVPPEAFISTEEERSVYELHRNSPNDPGYRKFLSRMCDPITSRLPTGSWGLDFGCGPGPTLSVMFEERGYPMEIYDPFFSDDDSVLKHQYDFVTATEVVEHLREPRAVLDRLWGYVLHGGYLGIMTKLVIDQKSFARWHYISDETHICFFSISTLRWLGRRWQSGPILLGSDVTLFYKINE